MNRLADNKDPKERFHPYQDTRTSKKTFDFAAGSYNKTSLDGDASERMVPHTQRSSSQYGRGNTSNERGVPEYRGVDSKVRPDIRGNPRRSDSYNGQSSTSNGSTKFLKSSQKHHLNNDNDDPIIDLDDQQSPKALKERPTGEPNRANGSGSIKSSLSHHRPSLLTAKDPVNKALDGTKSRHFPPKFPGSIPEPIDITQSQEARGFQANTSSKRKADAEQHPGDTSIDELSAPPETYDETKALEESHILLGKGTKKPATNLKKLTHESQESDDELAEVTSDIKHTNFKKSKTSNSSKADSGIVIYEPGEAFSETQKWRLMVDKPPRPHFLYHNTLLNTITLTNDKTEEEVLSISASRIRMIELCVRPPNSRIILHLTQDTQSKSGLKIHLNLRIPAQPKQFADALQKQNATITMNYKDK